MKISEFKAKCLGVLDRVGKTGKPVLVTRFGKPVAQVVAPDKREQGAWLGAMRGSGSIVGDIIAPVVSPHEWEALGTSAQDLGRGRESS